MTPLPPATQRSSPKPDARVAIIGNDTLLAIAPATAIQLAHACLASGFDLAVPASWGDELVASETLRQLERRHGEPAVLCTCPHVASRLLAAGADLAPFLVSIVAPPVAVARYLRALFEPRVLQLTYVGACPAGADPSIDVHLGPDEFLEMLRRENIALAAQPQVFDSVVPPDRRRWSSLPGGVPHPDAIARVERGRTLVEVRGEEVVTDLAQHLVAQEVVLLDVSARMGCVCAAGRDRLSALEPPRSPGPVIDVDVVVPLSRPLLLKRATPREPEPAARTSSAIPMPPDVTLVTERTSEAPRAESDESYHAARAHPAPYEAPSISKGWPGVGEREVPLESELEAVAEPELSPVESRERFDIAAGGGGLEVQRESTDAYVPRATEPHADREHRRRRSPPLGVPAIGGSLPRARTGERSLPRAYVAHRRAIGWTPPRPVPRYDERVPEPASPTAPLADAEPPMLAVEQDTSAGVLIESVRVEAEVARVRPLVADEALVDAEPAEAALTRREPTAVEAPSPTPEPSEIAAEAPAATSAGAPVESPEWLAAADVAIEEEPATAPVTEPAPDLEPVAPTLPLLDVERASAASRASTLPPIDVPPSPRPSTPADGASLSPRGALFDDGSASEPQEPSVRERLSRLPAMLLLGLIALLTVVALALFVRR